MGTSSFPLYVSYNQICVFLSELPQPFNHWDTVHVDQGFSWRLGSVSFRTLGEEGLHNVEIVTTTEECLVAPDALRVIEVPFDVTRNGEVEVASISDSIPIKLVAGNYTLRCELFDGTKNGEYSARFIFMSQGPREFKIIRADDALNIRLPLVKNATPAD